MTNPPTSTLDARCFIGGPATGKTTKLIDRACYLAASKERSVLMVCASEATAASARRTLRERGASSVSVRTAYEVAYETVAADAIARNAAPVPQVLDPLAEQAFFEDMKPCGIKPRRLRELLAFLYRGWSDLADADPHWIQTTEEELVIELIEKNLSFTGGILKPELSHRSVGILLGDQNALLRHKRNHVLVDDYTLLGKASQMLVNLIAVRSITIATDDAAPPPVCEPYPYADGLPEFLKAHPHASICNLVTCYRPRGIVDALNNLRHDRTLGGTALQESTADTASPCTVRIETGLADECRTIVERVQEALADGFDPADLLVVGQNDVWRANVVRAFASCGIPAHHSSTSERRKGIARNTARTASDEERVVRQLARNPRDPIAWRTWCGFGDHLARSAAVAGLRDAALSTGMDFTEALEALSSGNIEGLPADKAPYADLVEAYQGGLRSIEAFKDRTCGCISDDRTAASPSQNRGTETPTAEAESVCVCAPFDAFGHEAAVVIFGGFVKGFIPSRAYCTEGGLVGNARTRAHRANLQAMHLCVGRARQSVLFTGFSSCGLETAETLDLHIARIRLSKGVRVCTIEPSDLLELLPNQSGR